LLIFRGGHKLKRIIGGDLIKMILRNKIIPIALVALLLGGTVGAFVSNRNSQPTTTTASTTSPSAGLFDNQNVRQTLDTSRESRVATQTSEIADLASYRAGFLDGFLAARDNKVSGGVTTDQTVVPNTRVVYRNVPTVRTRSYRSYSPQRQVYYDYNNQPRSRSFWQKHRDKLTVAMGTGGGAILGALIGGRKGAAIGALAGAGGSALYTYKIRNRNRRY